jgi:hypothetical protein
MRIVEVARTLRRSGGPLLSLLTDRDLIADVVRFELMFPTCSQKGMKTAPGDVSGGRFR